MAFNKKLVISEMVRGVLSELEFGDGTAKIVKQLDRTLYQHVNKILEALGGKWNRGQGCHVFETKDVESLVEDVLITGYVVNTKKSFDFFETPAKVAQQVISAAWIKAGQAVLEPSAGKGALAKLARLTAPSATFALVEIQPDNCAILKADGFKDVIQADFMDLDFGVTQFDRVIMNPPFSRKQDIRHVTKAYSLLKKGGRLVAIMSAGIEFRQDREFKEFRALVDDAGGEMERLPEKSFAVSGTSVNTVIVVLNR